MGDNERFIEELGKIYQLEYSNKVRERLPNVGEVPIEFLLDFNSDSVNKLLEGYNLPNEVIKVQLEIKGFYIGMKYCYKGNKVDPNCYYIRPDFYREPTTLEILRECVKQDTNCPDIKHLENYRYNI